MAESKAWYRNVAVAICCLVPLCGPAVASTQAAAPTPASPAGPSHGLFITILEGEGALNDIRQRTAREPIIQVEDENHRPVAGAAVLFGLPTSGPSAVFPDGTSALSTVTDSSGRAVAQGLRPNNISGSYNIRVRVNFNGSTAETTIHQKNVSAQSSMSQHAAHAMSMKTILIIVGAAAAAGTAAAVLELNSGGNSTVITAGPPAVGAPANVPGVRIALRQRNSSAQ